MIHVGDSMSTVEVFSTVGYSNNKRFPPTVLNTLHGTHDIPHMHHDSPHGTEHPHGTLDNPTVLMIPPTVLNTPWYARYLPHLY